MIENLFFGNFFKKKHRISKNIQRDELNCFKISFMVALDGIKKIQSKW